MSISTVSTNFTSTASGTDSSDLATKLFARIDGDGDGKVTEDEFSAAMEKRLGKTDSDSAASIFKAMDSDGDGGINVSEFKTAMEQMREQSKSAAAGENATQGPAGAGGPPPSAEEEADEVFDELDTNEDGVVSIDELLASLESDESDSASTDSTDTTESATQKEKLEALFNAADGDGDGSLTKAELTTVIEQLRKRAEDDEAKKAAYAADGSVEGRPAVGTNLSVEA
jgi:Ca2+-binding EF-hand superfamily protein